MGKGILIIIGILVIIGLLYYYKPEQTKDVTSKSIDKIGSMIKNYYDSREINLGQPSMPCVDNKNCNDYIGDCYGNCTCINGECYKNVPNNST